MKTIVTLNTIEIEQAISQYVCKRYPKMAVAIDGVTISSSHTEPGTRISLSAAVELVPAADYPDAFGRHDG